MPSAALAKRLLENQVQANVSSKAQWINDRIRKAESPQYNVVTKMHLVIAP